MAVQKSDKETTVVATFEVVTTEGTTEVRSHQAAWVATQAGPHPATANFVGWKRKD